MNRWTKIIGTLSAASFLAGASHGQDENASEAIEVLTPFNVIGKKADVSSLQGTGTVLDASDLGPYFHTDVTEILRQVPGVYVRQEEGYGLFPNISLRGVDPNRSSKVTIMEDGIPSSPSPFSDPSAYYSPTAGRMSGFEILKGSSQLTIGPNTTGGVINYLSTPIPAQQLSHLRASYGQNNERISHAYSGGTTSLGSGTLGYFVEVFDHRTDGWKTINGFGDLSSANAPIAKTDLTFKLSYEFGDDNYLEFKTGRTDLDGDVSYIGLTATDFAANPYQRYHTTRYDNMDSDQTRTYLRYLKQFNEELSMTATIFSNEFNRDWYKIGKIRYDDPANGLGTFADAGDEKWKSVGKSPTQIFDGGNIQGVLTGTNKGQVKYKHNNRTYENRGIQANFDYESGRNSFDLGFRYTTDTYTNNPYTEDNYYIDTDNSLMELNGTSAGTYANGKAYYRKSDALEIHLVDEIDLGALTLTPGIRYTDVDYEYKSSNHRSLDDILIGLGARYRVSESLAIFGGVHQGHSLPGAEGGSSESTKGLRDIEESLGFEIGVRGNAADLLSYELAFFNTSYDNMIASSSLASGVENSANVGDASVSGFEVLLATDLGRNMAIGIPLSFAATFTDSEFDVVSGSGTGYWSDAAVGNELPYIPDFQYNLRGGLVFDKFSTYLNYHYQADVYTSADNVGKLEEYGVLDWSAFYTIKEGVTVFGKVTNLADKEYAVSHMPDGYRPGAPQVASFGMSFDF